MDASGEAARPPVPAFGVPLPAGLVPLPELGAGVVGTFISEPAARKLRIKGWLWSVLALASAALAWSNRSDLLSMVFGIVLVVSAALLAAGDLLPARLGDLPALVVDGSAVTCLVPFGRVSVRLDAITTVRRLRSELLLRAPGGITRRRRLTRERWASVNHAGAFEVSVDDLAAYLATRADAGTPQG